MNKLFFIVLFIGISLAGTSYLMYKRIVSLENERDKYKANTYSLLTDIKKLQVDSTTLAADTKVLHLKIDELKEHRAADLEHIQKLNVRIKSLEAIGKHSLEVHAPIQAEIKDSVIVRDTVKVYVKSVKMDTPHLQVKGIIEDNRLKGDIYLPVTLHQAIWVEHKHRFLWWRWGVKAVHQTISSDNPYVDIKFTEIIRVEK